MAAISCPKCQSLLKMASLPRTNKSVKCPRCGEPFVISGTAITTAPKAAPVAIATPMGPSRTVVISNQRPLVFAGLAMLLIGVAVGVYLAWPKPEPLPLPLPSPASPAVVETKTPPEPASPSEADIREQKLLESKALLQKQKDFNQWMIKGGIALQVKKFEDALPAFTEALQLFPEDADARAGLQETRTALAEIAKEQQTQEKLRDNVAALVRQGQESLEKKQFAAAEVFFKLALDKAPTESEASVGLKSALDGIARDKDEKQKQADFDRLVNAGRASLKAGRYEDALRDFTAAGGVLPDSPLVLALQRQAEQEIDLQRKQQARKIKFDATIDLARNAFRAKDYSEAEKLFGDALQIIPDDAAANREFTEAQKLGKQAQADFQVLLNRANLALKTGSTREAADAYRDALKLFPKNETVQKALRELENSQDRQATYRDAMRRGSTAMTFQRYGDALQAFNDALRAVPNDPFAIRGLQEAQARALEEAKTIQEIDRKLNLATAALKQTRYAEAAQLLGDVARSYPNHPQILNIQRQSRYADAMAKANSAMSSQNYRDAVRHFQLALLENPSDFAANAGLTRARSLSKN